MCKHPKSGKSRLIIAPERVHSGETHCLRHGELPIVELEMHHGLRITAFHAAASVCGESIENARPYVGTLSFIVGEAA